MWFYFRKVNVRELVIAQAAATPSSAIRNDFPNMIFHKLRALIFLLKSYEIAKSKGFTTHVGNVLSDDVFTKIA